MRQLLQKILGSVGVFALMMACSTQDQNTTTPRKIVKTNDPDGTGTGSNNGGDTNGNGDGGTGGTGGTKFDGKAYFTDTLSPLFEVKCASCHADPRNAPANPGPLTIFNYDKMKIKLQDGNASDNNAFINKVRNKASHDGGDRCNGDIKTSPCPEIIAWYNGEFGSSTTGGSGSAGSSAGEISSVSITGRAVGWAVNEADATASIKVHLYVDGEKGVGTAVPEITANQTGYDNGHGQKHAFTADLPTTYADGKEHKLYAFAVIGDKEAALKGSPLIFHAYQKKADGQTFFNGTVKAKLDSTCGGGCHVNDYDGRWASLASPTPDQGGTKTNNLMVLKGSGQMNHGGGNKCGGASSGVCADLQTWWTKEFGP